MVHVTKDGKKIKLRDLESDHLKNIIKLIERKSEGGRRVIVGKDGVDIDNVWFDEEYYSEKEIKDSFNYQHYVDELTRREIVDKNNREDMFNILRHE